MMIYTIEANYFDLNTASAKVLYLSTGQFATKSADTPSNTQFYPYIIDPGSIGISIYSEGLVAGKTQLQIGEVTLINTGGILDFLKVASFGNRDIIIRYGDNAGAYPSTFKTVFYGTAQSFEIGYDQVVIQLMDKSYRLQQPLLTDKYGGTNALPAGIDGTADDIKGLIKPRVYGTVYNVQPIQVNTSKLIYQVHSGNALSVITTVYDQGIALTFGTDRANNAAMQATAPAAGSYDTCLAEGLIRLGATPAGMITMDCSDGATAAARTVGQIMKSIAADAGVTVYASDVTAMDTDNLQECGLYVNDDRNISQALDEIAATINAFYYYDNINQFRIDWVVGYDNILSYVDLFEANILNIDMRYSVTNIPVYKVSANYKNIETVQTSDLAGAVTDARRAFLSKPYRKGVATYATVKTQNLNARSLEIASRFIVSTDASDEADRIALMYGSPSFIYDVTIPIEEFDYNLMDGIMLYHSRFDMPALPYTALIGYTLNLSDNTATLNLWGA